MSAVFAILMVGCTPDSRYDLHLEPIVPLNLEMALGTPDLTLVHRTDQGSTLLPLGSFGDAFGDLPPLTDGTVGLLLGDPGTATELYQRSTLRGYGEAPLGGELIDQEEQRTVELLITEFGGTGELGELVRRSAPLLGAGVLMPNGVAAVFGGQRDGEPHAQVSVLDGLPSDFEFREVDPLPEPRVLFTATALDDGRVLITGGRAEYFTVGDNLSSALIWDPATEEIVWSEGGVMAPGRSRHAAVRMRDSRVLVVGGWQGAGVDTARTTYQFFDPTAQRFEDPGEVGAGALGLMATSLGGDGALVCGGYRLNIEASVMTPEQRCDRITLTGDPIPFEDLPDPVGMAAITSLPDGRVLVAGGVTETIPIPFEDGFLVGANTGAATDAAWLFTPNEGWLEVGPMRHARAGAVAVPSGDGRIVIIGGAERAGVLIADDANPVFCPEVFDPELGVFEVQGSCSTPGSGAFPIVAAQPGLGAFVVEGHHVDDLEQRGGRGYGIIGLAPPL